jgi:hypothetical protein
MKFAIAGSAFSAALDRGDLTQLEFIDGAARELRCDGVVLDVRHFPRTDDDYLAQIKKMAADLGLCIAALENSAFFTAGDDVMQTQLEWALRVGAPLFTGTLAAETVIPWSEQLARLNAATSFAKAANVTLAVRNAPATFAATSHDCKRVSKEADSAWLRFALDPAAFDPASEWTALLGKTVLGHEEIDAAPQLERWAGFGGFVALSQAAGTMTIAKMNEAMRPWRTARAQFELNRI